MNKGLQTRLAFAFIGIASGIVLLACFILIFETHYHFSLYQRQLPEGDVSIGGFDSHFEQALVQSIAWTSVGAVILAIAVSFYVAKRITAPLVEMRKIAEQMTHGHLQSRVTIRGNDELSDLAFSLNHLAEQLQKQEKLRKSITADVAHELRTPLATLKSHMMAFEDGIWKPTPERIRGCYEEIERLIRLVSDIEQLSYVESPAFSLRRQKEDLFLIVRQGVETMRAAYVQKGIDLEFEGKEDIEVWIDGQRIIQIIVNLLSNALKFTPPDGFVRVQVKAENEAAVITVTDTGIGIPEEKIAYVFERFFRADKSRNRKFGGAGIGLTIVKRLAEAHGGNVRIESEEGGGTIVYVQLPYTQVTSK